MPSLPESCICYVVQLQAWHHYHPSMQPFPVINGKFSTEWSHSTTIMSFVPWDVNNQSNLFKHTCFRSFTCGGSIPKYEFDSKSSTVRVCVSSDVIITKGIRVWQSATKISSTLLLQPRKLRRTFNTIINLIHYFSSIKWNPKASDMRHLV